MAKNNKKAEKEQVEKLSFEQAIGELTEIVGQIEQGRIPLQQSLEQYEKGMKLIGHCKNILQTAEKRIEMLSAKDSNQADE